MIEFLKLVRDLYWIDTPKAWNVCLRGALSDKLVRVGWGGRIEITDAGREAIAQSQR